jgi:Ser/Thr protein kinase RdoA (MazF antagonist)
VPATLARFHAHFAARAAELRTCEYLLRLDAAYFKAWATRALEIARRHGVQADQVAAVVRGYDGVAATLEAQPPTLVHNDLAPKNVLADRTARPPRAFYSSIGRWPAWDAACSISCT